jgi:hypothetical protein
LTFRRVTLARAERILTEATMFDGGEAMMFDGGDDACSTVNP